MLTTTTITELLDVIALFYLHTNHTAPKPCPPPTMDRFHGDHDQDPSSETSNTTTVTFTFMDMRTDDRVEVGLTHQDVYRGRLLGCGLDKTGRMIWPGMLLLLLLLLLLLS